VIAWGLLWVLLSFVAFEGARLAVMSFGYVVCVVIRCCCSICFGYIWFTCFWLVDVAFGTVVYGLFSYCVWLVSVVYLVGGVCRRAFHLFLWIVDWRCWTW